jgi:hypothetical protein
LHHQKLIFSQSRTQAAYYLGIEVSPQLTLPKGTDIHFGKLRQNDGTQEASGIWVAFSLVQFFDEAKESIPPSGDNPIKSIIALVTQF